MTPLPPVSLRPFVMEEDMFAANLRSSQEQTGSEVDSVRNDQRSTRDPLLRNLRDNAPLLSQLPRSWRRVKYRRHVPRVLHGGSIDSAPQKTNWEVGSGEWWLATCLDGWSLGPSLNSLGDTVERSTTSPCQHALSRRRRGASVWPARCKVSIELDPQSTVLSINGMSA